MSQGLLEAREDGWSPQADSKSGEADSGQQECGG